MHKSTVGFGYALAFPIEGKDGPIERVTIRRPKGKDLRAFEEMKGSQMAVTAAMIATLTELTVEQFDQLDVADINGLSEIVEGFFPAPGAGAAS